MVVFHSYVELPEGKWEAKELLRQFPDQMIAKIGPEGSSWSNVMTPRTMVVGIYMHE